MPIPFLGSALSAPAFAPPPIPSDAKVLRVRAKLHPVQAAFCKSTALFRGFVGGRGAGKSKVGAYDLLTRASRNPGRHYVVTDATYPDLKDGAIRSFLGIARKANLLARYNITDHDATLINDAVVSFRSTDKPETLRGPNVSGVWMDEASRCDREAYEILISCLREGGVLGWLSATFTPKGKSHWTYSVFGTERPNTALFHARTSDNPFLPASFYETRKAEMTSKKAEQEMHGLFTDMEGSLFNRSWFKRFSPTAPMDALRVRYWDKAASEEKGCYTAGVRLSRTPEGIYYVEDVVRGQWSPGERNARMLATAAGDSATLGDFAPRIWVEQEGGGDGKDVAEQMVKMFVGYPIHIDHPSGQGAKLVRAEPFAAQCEHGNVVIVQGPWNEDWIDELCNFAGKSGEYADQVDASSGAFNRLVNRGGSNAPEISVHREPGVLADWRSSYLQPGTHVADILAGRVGGVNGNGTGRNGMGGMGGDDDGAPLGADRW